MVVAFFGVVHDCLERVSSDRTHSQRRAGITEDATALRQAESERAALEARLFQAQKLESLGTLASGISHDFNNILGILLGQVTVLETQPEASLAQRLQTIREAAQRGAGVVRRPMTLARKEASRGPTWAPQRPRGRGSAQLSPLR